LPSWAAMKFRCKYELFDCHRRMYICAITSQLCQRPLMTAKKEARHIVMTNNHIQAQQYLQNCTSVLHKLCIHKAKEPMHGAQVCCDPCALVDWLHACSEGSFLLPSVSCWPETSYTVCHLVQSVFKRLGSPGHGDNCVHDCTACAV
jgi:hypothetical protein